MLSRESIDDAGSRAHDRPPTLPSVRQMPAAMDWKPISQKRSSHCQSSIPPQREYNVTATQSGWPDLNRRFPAPEAGGLGQAFPHPEVDRQSAQRESNPHFRHGKAIGCRYIMGTVKPTPNCQRSAEHRVGLEPTSPPYECGVFAARRPVHQSRVGSEGLEPSPTWLRARHAAANTLIPSQNLRVGPGGVEPPSSGYQPGALPLSYKP